jgi:hypothetical protein
MSETPDRVAADLRAHEAAEEKRPFWTCKGCRAELFEENAVAQNWLVCKVCGEALCENCCVEMAAAGVVSFVDSAQSALRFEPLQNAGVCSTACLARAYDLDGWEYRKSRLLKHCEDAMEGANAIAVDPACEIIRLALMLQTLADRVRAVCNLDRGKR